MAGSLREQRHFVIRRSGGGLLSGSKVGSAGLRKNESTLFRRSPPGSPDPVLSARQPLLFYLR